MKSEQYMEEVTRTLSNQFHTDRYPAEDGVRALVEFEFFAAQLDRIKKAFFYGKEPKPMPTFVMPEDLSYDVDDMHFLFGMITEIAELSEVMRAKWRGEEVGSKPEDEMGDLMWYQYNWLKKNGFDPDVIMAGNIAKLRARFPEKFTDHEAIHRNESAEETALKTALER